VALVFFVGILPPFSCSGFNTAFQSRTLGTRPRGIHPQGHSLRPYLRPLIVLTAANTCGMFAWWGLFTWIPAYLVLPTAQGGRGFTSLSLTAFSSPSIYWECCRLSALCIAADRFGRRPLSWSIYWQPHARYAAGCGAPACPDSSLRYNRSLFRTGFFTGSAIIGSELFPTQARATALGIPTTSPAA